MANSDKSGDSNKRTTVQDIRSIVENANAEDEKDRNAKSGDDDEDDTSDDAENGDDTGNDDDSGADDSNDDDDASGDDSEKEDDDSDDDDSDDSDAETDTKDRKFTQFAGDGTDDQYISNLEKGYQNSSSEAIRLKGELDQATGRVDAIMRAASTDPELATKLNAAFGADGAGAGDGADSNSDDLADPFVQDLRTKWNKTSQEEIETFIEANPEVATDPQIASDVKKWMGIFSRQHLKDTKTLMSGGEAMAKAYSYLGLENKLDKQNLAQGAKRNAAPTRPQKSRKKNNSATATFTADQIAMAKAMGKDEAWLTKNSK